jgi:hypothetical protein
MAMEGTLGRGLGGRGCEVGMRRPPCSTLCSGRGGGFSAMSGRGDGRRSSFVLDCGLTAAVSRLSAGLTAGRVAGEGA